MSRRPTELTRPRWTTCSESSRLARDPGRHSLDRCPERLPSRWRRCQSNKCTLHKHKINRPECSRWLASRLRRPTKTTKTPQIKRAMVSLSWLRWRRVVRSLVATSAATTLLFTTSLARTCKEVVIWLSGRATVQRALKQPLMLALNSRRQPNQRPRSPSKSVDKSPLRTLPASATTLQPRKLALMSSRLSTRSTSPTRSGATSTTRTRSTSFLTNASRII